MKDRRSVVAARALPRAALSPRLAFGVFLFGLCAATSRPAQAIPAPVRPDAVSAIRVPGVVPPAAPSSFGATSLASTGAGMRAMPFAGVRRAIEAMRVDGFGCSLERDASVEGKSYEVLLKMRWRLGG